MRRAQRRHPLAASRPRRSAPAAPSRADRRGCSAPRARRRRRWRGRSGSGRGRRRRGGTCAEARRRLGQAPGGTYHPLRPISAESEMSGTFRSQPRGTGPGHRQGGPRARSQFPDRVPSRSSRRPALVVPAASASAAPPPGQGPRRDGGRDRRTRMAACAVGTDRPWVGARRPTLRATAERRRRPGRQRDVRGARLPRPRGLGAAARPAGRHRVCRTP